MVILWSVVLTSWCDYLSSINWLIRKGLWRKVVTASLPPLLGYFSLVAYKRPFYCFMQQQLGLLPCMKKCIQLQVVGSLPRWHKQGRGFCFLQILGSTDVDSPGLPVALALPLLAFYLSSCKMVVMQSLFHFLQARPAGMVLSFSCETELILPCLHPSLPVHLPQSHWWTHPSKRPSVSLSSREDGPTTQ